MAAYIDSDYVRARWGEQLELALTQRLGGDLDAWIESASATVQSLVAAMGFTVGSTSTDPLIQKATFASLWEGLAANPKASMKLPEGWAENPYRKALGQLEDKSASQYLATVAGLSLDVAIAVGGTLWTDTTSTGDDPRRTTSDELAGY